MSMEKSVIPKNRHFSVELCSNKTLNFELLNDINPLFYSVTWHFKNSCITDNSAMVMAMNLTAQGKDVLLHLPCRYMTKQNVHDILTLACQNNIKNIFALLGERLKDYENVNDFKYAVDLVKYIKENFNDKFCIFVAGYPQKHPEQSKYEVDLKYLKEKVVAGADYIITQVIFEPQTFYNFYKDCRNIDINIPIIPGLYLINSYETVINMARICHVAIPDNVLRYFEEVKHDNNALQKYAEGVIKELLNNDLYPIDGIHLFCLNNIELVKKLVSNLF